MSNSGQGLDRTSNAYRLSRVPEEVVHQHPDLLRYVKPLEGHGVIVGPLGPFLPPGHALLQLAHLLWGQLADGAVHLHQGLNGGVKAAGDVVAADRDVLEGVKEQDPFLAGGQKEGNGLAAWTIQAEFHDAAKCKRLKIFHGNCKQ